MLMSRDEIIADIQEQIRKSGGNYNAWCVGTAKDSHSTLFSRHQVEELRDGWIYREAFTPGVARDVQDHFVTQCGTECDAGSEEDGGRIVYAYKMTSQADQPSPATAPMPNRSAVIPACCVTSVKVPLRLLR